MKNIEGNELNQVQLDCDHDWEYLEDSKQCTYPECQAELELTSDDVQELNDRAVSFESEQQWSNS